MTVIDHADPAWTQPADVRLCDVCGRPMAARNKNEYTADRARLVVARGLCVCPMGALARGPSLI